MRTLFLVLLGLLGFLQFRLWVGEGSLAEVYNLRLAVAHQQAEVERQERANRALQAEVKDLKGGLAAIEELARSELGMIRPGETFYQVLDAPARHGAERP